MAHDHTIEFAQRSEIEGVQFSTNHPRQPSGGLRGFFFRVSNSYDGSFAFLTQAFSQCSGSAADIENPNCRRWNERENALVNARIDCQDLCQSRLPPEASYRLTSFSAERTARVPGVGFDRLFEENCQACLFDIPFNKTQVAIASEPSVARLAHAAPCQPYRGMSQRFSARLTPAADS